ncbi:hypothetical protein B0H12DRAFT_1246046 [Mycena haematopus]|nr:hypothetical protein B0H12DRAFT_1246046 [Mycena haematopus]
MAPRRRRHPTRRSPPPPLVVPPHAERGFRSRATGLEADRGSPPRPSGSTIYNQSVSDDAEVSGDELESNSFSIPINAPGPLLKHSHPDSAYWLPFDNDESRRVVVLFSEDGEINNLSALAIFNILLAAAPFSDVSCRFSNPIPNVELFLWSTHAACYALQERYPTIFTQSVNTPAGYTYTNLSGYLGLAPDKGVKARLRTAANGPLFLLGSDYHIPAVQPPPKSAARSSAPTKRLAPVNDDSDVEMPAPSKKQRFQEVEVRVSPPPRPVPRPAARKTSPPEVPRPPPAPTQSVASSSKLPSTVPSTRKEVLAANPQKPVNIPTRGVRPLPALEVIPSHFVQDACTPALFSDASFACLSCINRAKSSSCDGRQFGTPCKTCKDNNTHCSYKADPERFIGLMEDLRPLFTLGTDALSSALLSVVRARQEADSAYRHLAYRLSVYDLALTDLIRDPSDRELLAQLAERSELVRADMERTFTRQHPTSTPYARPDAPDSRPVFNKRYPPDLNSGPSLVDDIPGIENISPAIFAGGAALLSEGEILPDAAPRSTTPTFTSLEGLGSAGPSLQPPPTSPTMPARQVPSSSFGSFGLQPPSTSQLIAANTDIFNPPPLPVYDLTRMNEPPRVHQAFSRGGFTVVPSSRKPAPPSS